jgi:membrane-bound metal-dependent hydrolase YbcI (DUF457 family)
VALFGFGLQSLLGFSQILSVILLIVGLFGVFYLEKLLTKRARQLGNLSKGLIGQKQIKFMLKFTSGILSLFILSLLLLIWKERFRQEILWLLIVGFGAHLLGDFVTKDGIPIFWPIQQRFGLRLFRTGSWVEGLIGAGLLIVNAYLIYLFWGKFGLSSAAYWRGYLDW